MNKVIVIFGAGKIGRSFIGQYQAIAAVRAGGNVALVNCVGDDAYTPQMLAGSLL